MLDLAKKVEASLGDGITVIIGVLPLRKQRELLPIIKMLEDSTTTEDSKIDASVTAIHDILTFFGNTVSKDVISDILTTHMLTEIFKIAYGKQD